MLHAGEVGKLRKKWEKGEILAIYEEYKRCRPFYRKKNTEPSPWGMGRGWQRAVPGRGGRKKKNSVQCKKRVTGSGVNLERPERGSSPISSGRRDWTIISGEKGVWEKGRRHGRMCMCRKGVVEEDNHLKKTNASRWTCGKWSTESKKGRKGMCPWEKVGMKITKKKKVVGSQLI